MVLAFIVLAIVTTALSKRPRREVVDAATVQAEKDVMRANHAVEVAALERRLAAAQGRGLEGGDTALKIAEAKKEADGLRREMERLKQDALTQQNALKTLTEERDALARKAAAASDKAAERERALSAREAEHEAALAALRAERDKAQADARDRAETIKALREEVATVSNRLVRPDGPATEAPKPTSAGEMAAAVAAKGVAEREAKGLREERNQLRARIEAAEEQTRTANAELSRLSYEMERLRSAATAHERRESEARAKVEQREAMLELRQQRIYELEGQVRTLNGELREASGGKGTAMSALESRLDVVTTEKAALLAELEAMRQTMAASAEGADEGAAAAALAEKDEALKAQLDALKAENETLRAASQDAAALSEAEVAALRRELHDLAQKFIDMSAPPEAAKSPEEMTLAERIRAFKAARAAAS